MAVEDARAVAQLFKDSADSMVRAVLLAIVVLVVGVLLGLYFLDYSSYNTAVGFTIEQPVPFSHEHHVGGLGIDCRYCHQSVERSSFAGMPAASVCMNCHAHVWNHAPMLAPIRESYEKGVPIAWQRVYDLPDFSYFNHSIHVAKGIGCESCHGRVDRMPLTWKVSNLKMEWCLDCHRNPTPHVRSPDEVTVMGWQVPAGEDARSYHQKWAEFLNVKSLTDCHTCHR